TSRGRSFPIVPHLCSGRCQSATPPPLVLLTGPPRTGTARLRHTVVPAWHRPEQRWGTMGNDRPREVSGALGTSCQCRPRGRARAHGATSLRGTDEASSFGTGRAVRAETLPCLRFTSCAHGRQW